MDWQEACALLKEKLGDYKVMALATSRHDHPTVRLVSCIFYNDKVYFKTDKNFRKTRMLLDNPQAALCVGGVQLEGTVENLGLVADEPGQIFAEKYERYLKHSYNAYAHTDTEILICFTPRFAEIWDDDEAGNAHQIYMYFDEKRTEFIPYD